VKIKKPAKMLKVALVKHVCLKIIKYFMDSCDERKKGSPAKQKKRP
jgi:hypothetical protein